MESSKGDKAMTSGKTSAAVLGLVGGVVLGAWIGTELTMNREVAAQAPAAVTTQTVAEAGGAGGARQTQARAPCRTCRLQQRRRQRAGTGIRT